MEGLDKNSFKIITTVEYSLGKKRNKTGSARHLEYSWIFIWNFSGPGKPGEMMLFFEI